MIKTKVFETSDKQIFTNIGLARQHELALFLNSVQLPSLVEGTPEDTEFKEVLAAKLNEHADKIVDLLTLKATSRPAARKTNKKKGKTADTASAAPTPATLAAD